MVDVKRSTRDDTKLKVNPRIAELEAEVASMHDNFSKMNAHYGGQADRIDELEAENQRLREALERVDSILRNEILRFLFNDLYRNRVRNALIEIQDALEGE